ncbi:MAG TPA: hypothetical protein VIT67_14440 [Povalibacter sp.]
MTLKDVVEFGGTALALAALIFGVYQYYVAQKWQRAEFAAKQLLLLSSDVELDLCCKLLDWSGRVSSVPEKYRDATDQRTFEHNWLTLKEAMLPEEEADRARWDWQHAMYRDIFDRYFEYLERINHYISIKLIYVHDVASLGYWLEQLDRPRFLAPADQGLFREFIDRYRYAGVRELTRRFRDAGIIDRTPDEDAPSGVPVKAAPLAG